ncbi:MAG: hypothetical protein ACRBK7_02200 [Acidimicrobiales bacterium]
MTSPAEWIGPDEARRLIRRIVAMAEPDRQALIDACAAKCPPGKNKRQDQSSSLGLAA